MSSHAFPYGHQGLEKLFLVNLVVVEWMPLSNGWCAHQPLSSWAWYPWQAHQKGAARVLVIL
jgi:hypothetical protein